jgi:hypothetical protein
MGTYNTTANHSAGQWQDIKVPGAFSAGPHEIDIRYNNDAHKDGRNGGDRNLYVQSVTINGETVTQATSNTAANGMSTKDGSTILAINGIAEFDSHGTKILAANTVASITADTTAPADSTSPSNSSGLHVAVSEDAWRGDAKFAVFVDGHQVGGIYTAAASHALGQVQDVAIDDTFAAGPHTIDIHFINDAWGGAAATDRNLYVHNISLNGETLLGSAGINNAANGATTSDGSAPLNINGVVSFHTTGATMPSTTPTTTPTATASQSTIVLHVAEDAWNGHAQYKVFVDGHQVGGTHTATASHAAGQWQDVTLTGDFGSTGPAKVGIQFVNDAWGGTATTDRNLYVQSIDVNGRHFGANTATNNVANGEKTTDGSLILAINGTVEFNVNDTAAPDWHLA